MPTAEKARTIEQAKEWYSKSLGVVFTDYRGLKNKEMQDLRKTLRTKGGEMHVLKNTLFRIAAGDDAANMPADLHNGTTAVAFIFENEGEVAKSLLDYARTSKKLIVKGGFFGGKSFSAKDVQALSELPPRDVLISQVIGAIAAPLTNLVGVVEALYADPIRVIGAVADKVGEGSPAPAAQEVNGEVGKEDSVTSSEAASTEEAPVEEPKAEETPAQDIPADQPVETPADTNSTESSEEASS